MLERWLVRWLRSRGWVVFKPITFGKPIKMKLTPRKLWE